MAITKLPDVYVNENDFSQVIAEADASRVGVMTDSEQGYTGLDETDSGVLPVSSVQEFVSEYGKPQSTLEETALTILRAGQRAGVTPQVFVKRALPRDSNGDIDALWGGVEVADDSTSTSTASLGTGIVYPETNYTFPDDDVIFSVFARNPNDDNDLIEIEINNSPTGASELVDSNSGDLFEVVVFYDGQEVESYIVDREERTDVTGTQLYIEDKINPRSDYIHVIDNEGVAVDATPENGSEPYAMGGGTSGGNVTQDELATDVQVFNNTNEFDIRMIPTGGMVTESNLTFANQVISTCVNRQDCVAFIDTPEGLDANDLTTGNFYSNLSLPTGDNPGSYVAIYTPWVFDFEPQRQKQVKNPPSGYAIRSHIISFENNEPWFAVAGPQRGQLGVDGLEFTLDDADQETLYLDENTNPIATKFSYGNVIWGQKTYQTYSSLTDRLNVRFLLITLEKSIQTFARNFLFEFNDPTTWARLSTQISDYLESVQGRRGLVDFEVVIDSSNNDRTSNTLNGDIYLVPQAVAEVIELNFNITQSSADFNEGVATG